MALDGKREKLEEEVLNPESVGGVATSVVKSNRTLSYDYDLSSRLTQEKREERQSLRAGGETSSTRTTSFAYDAVGNRIGDVAKQYTGIGSNATLGNTFSQTYTYTYTYNDNDWLTKQQGTTTTAAGATTTYPATTYGYDDNGAQTSVTQNDVITPYEYDFEGKLVKVGNANSSTRYSYKYAAEGNRLSTTTGTSSGAKTSKFLNDAEAEYTQVLETRDENEQLQARYLYGNDYAPLRQDVRSEDGGNLLSRYYLSDGLSSTRQLADTQGGISDSYAYDAWGNNAGVVGNTPNSFRYNGQALEANGLYFLRARFYNAGMGRFLNHDPLIGSVRNPVTLHRYLYAGVNPISNVDPGGKDFSVTSVMASTGISTNVRTTSSVVYQEILNGVGDAFNVDVSAENVLASIINKNTGLSVTAQQVQYAGLALTAFNLARLGYSSLKNFKKARKAIRAQANNLQAAIDNLEEGGCFTKGTKVLMADGKKKAIEKIKLGDYVFSRDEKSGAVSPKKVLYLSIRETSRIWTLVFKNRHKVETTSEHPFYVHGKGFIAAKDLRVGDEIVTSVGNTLKLTATRNKLRSTKVYNITVADFHTYFVGNAGVWVHNIPCPRVNACIGTGRLKWL